MTPHSLRAGEVLEHRFDTREAGEVWAALTLAAPGTSWLRGDPAVLRLDVDGREPQDVILAAGDEPTEYARLLGRLTAGPHVLRLGVDERLSSPSARGPLAPLRGLATAGLTAGARNPT
ncbi:MAG: hypothetical protein E6H02_03915 [Bacillati bacterium ANGP1]|uniref:Uncharacterized protein n=1 Tax=Candidatus Segetimicrobium genomatis TaxID=2569760 RepID=A0A537M1H6_9BACT|nr:MAG: hypothetical protein E6H02_03915 [Terrabacteria group bacterium ANGP1]